MNVQPQSQIPSYAVLSRSAWHSQELITPTAKRNTIDSEALTADDAQKRKRNLNVKSRSKWSRVVELVKSPSKGIMNGKVLTLASEATSERKSIYSKTLRRCPKGLYELCD